MARGQAYQLQFVEIRRRLLTVALALLLVLVVGVVGYTLLTGGRHSLLDALYMTVISLTTVGYGEIIPLEHNPAGRIFTMVLLVFGMGILVYFASTVTAFVVEGQLGHVFWRKRMRQAIEELREHIIVCGAGVVAGHVVEELRRVRCGVVLIIPPGGDRAQLDVEGELLSVEGDPADEEVLQEAGIKHAAGLIPALESDRDNVLVTLTARQVNPIMRIVAMLVDSRHEAKLRRAGADAVVSPFRIGGLRMASEMIRPAVVTFLDSMLRDRERNLRVEEVTVGIGSPAIGRRVGELRLNEVPGLLLLAMVEPKGAKRHFKPDDGLVVPEGTTLIVMGAPEAVGELRSRYGGQHYVAVAPTAERPADRTAPGRA